jgi:hypothetical protein
MIVTVLSLLLAKECVPVDRRRLATEVASYTSDATHAPQLLALLRPEAVPCPSTCRPEQFGAFDKAVERLRPTLLQRLEAGDVEAWRVGLGLRVYTDGTVFERLDDTLSSAVRAQPSAYLRAAKTVPYRGPALQVPTFMGEALADAEPAARCGALRARLDALAAVKDAELAELQAEAVRNLQSELAECASREPADRCQWETFSDAAVGLAAFIQRCDYGYRTIDFLFANNSLAIRYSDATTEPDPLVDVLPLTASETPEAGITRFFAEHTDKAIASRCVLATYQVEGSPTPAGVARFTFRPDAAFAKEVRAKEVPGEIPDPACGEWGEAPDGIQYFETQPASGARAFLFVRMGQDEPLFDEQTLRLLPR